MAAVNILLTIEQYLQMVNGPIEVEIGGGATVKLAVDATWNDVASRYQPGYGDVTPPGCDYPGKLCTVTLTNSGTNMLNMMKTLRIITGLNASEVKKLMDAVPSVITDNVGSWEADGIMDKINQAGGTVSITEN